MVAEKATTQFAAGAKRLIRTHSSTVQTTGDDRLHRIATGAALPGVQTTDNDRTGSMGRGEGAGRRDRGGTASSGDTDGGVTRRVVCSKGPLGPQGDLDPAYSREGATGAPFAGAHGCRVPLVRKTA